MPNMNLFERYVATTIAFIKCYHLKYLLVLFRLIYKDILNHYTHLLYPTLFIVKHMLADNC